MRDLNTKNSRTYTRVERKSYPNAVRGLLDCETSTKTVDKPENIAPDKKKLKNLRTAARKFSRSAQQAREASSLNPTHDPTPARALRTVHQLRIWNQASDPSRFLINQWNRNRRPQLESQITSWENVKLIKFPQKHQFGKFMGLGSGVPIPLAINLKVWNSWAHMEFPRNLNASLDCWQEKDQAPSD